MRINSCNQARSLLPRKGEQIAEERNRVLKKIILHCALLCPLAR